MTMPHLMNCPHSGDGWCLKCVQEEYKILNEKKYLEAFYWKEQLKKHCCTKKEQNVIEHAFVRLVDREHL